MLSLAQIRKLERVEGGCMLRTFNATGVGRGGRLENGRESAIW